MGAFLQEKLRLIEFFPACALICDLFRYFFVVIFRCLPQSQTKDKENTKKTQREKRKIKDNFISQQSFVSLKILCLVIFCVEISLEKSPK